MNRLDLNRRQFLQFSTCAAVGVQCGAGVWAMGPDSAANDRHAADVDPHLTLAAAHQFVDHDVWSWAQSTRICGSLALDQLGRLKSILAEHATMDSEFSQGEEVWVTLTLQAPALHRMLQCGTRLFTDYIWGAPWSHPFRMTAPAFMAERSVPRRPILDEAWLASRASSSPQRVLVIDHGFPVERLQHLGVPHLHLSSRWAHPQIKADLRAHSHAAQVMGLLMHGVDGLGTVPNVPLVLFELPQDILNSMPYAALWPEVLDAVFWVVSASKPGCEWIIMLSLVSTDADRHAQSFISRSARALTAFARSKGVTLTWVMAAGNSHTDQQNLDLTVHAQQPAEMSWYLQPENFRPSFLECWHDVSMGLPMIEVRPPGGSWTDRLHPMSMATRIHEPSARAQTLLRLPPTATWASSEALAQSGDWGVRFEFDHKGTLSLHLAMMTATPSGPLRQARIRASACHLADPATPYTLSGLIPHMPQVVVAQTLDPTSASWWIDRPTRQQLSSYCGRWPDRAPWHWHAMGFQVDASKVQRGALTWSRHGHRTQRASGTSMAVPLTARLLLGLA